MGYSTSNKRPLNIKFDIYSDGDDNQFKVELLSLMRGSVLELQLAAANSLSLRNPDIFKKAAHKAKSTLILLDDSEFFEVVETFRKDLSNLDDESSKDLNHYQTDKFNEICDSIVESLDREAEQLRAS